MFAVDGRTGCALGEGWRSMCNGKKSPLSVQDTKWG